MNKSVKVAFLASLVVNVLLIGVLLGGLPNRRDKRPEPQERMAAVAERLPEPARATFLSKIGQMHQEVQPLRDQIQAARAEALRALGAEPFDEAAFDRQVSKVTELRVELFKRLSATMKAIAKEFPLEQRQALAKAFERPPSSRQ